MVLEKRSCPVDKIAKKKAVYFTLTDCFFPLCPLGVIRKVVTLMTLPNFIFLTFIHVYLFWITPVTLTT